MRFISGMHFTRIRVRNPPVLWEMLLFNTVKTLCKVPCPLNHHKTWSAFSCVQFSLNGTGPSEDSSLSFALFPTPRPLVWIWPFA